MIRILVAITAITIFTGGCTAQKETNHPMQTEKTEPKPKCTACESTDLMPVVYGMPVPGMCRPDIHFGGCMPPSDGKPRAICRTCGMLVILDYPLQVQPAQGPSAPVTTNPCSRCGLEGRHLVPIVYGMPVPTLPGPEFPNVGLGGCMPPADGKPRAACPRCGNVIILEPSSPKLQPSKPAS